MRHWVTSFQLLNRTLNMGLFFEHANAVLRRWPEISRLPRLAAPGRAGRGGGAAL